MRYLWLSAAAFRSGSGWFRHWKIHGDYCKNSEFFSVFHPNPARSARYQKNCHLQILTCYRAKKSAQNVLFKKLKTLFFFLMFVLKNFFILFTWFFNKIKKINMQLKYQGMKNPTNRKALNSIQNKLNYKSVKGGMSSGNLANFSTLIGCNLAGNPLFQVFFVAFSMLAWNLLISKTWRKSDI